MRAFNLWPYPLYCQSVPVLLFNPPEYKNLFNENNSSTRAASTGFVSKLNSRACWSSQSCLITSDPFSSRFTHQAIFPRGLQGVWGERVFSEFKFHVQGYLSHILHACRYRRFLEVSIRNRSVELGKQRESGETSSSPNHQNYTILAFFRSGACSNAASFHWNKDF
ncbi:unnamed protein product [Allacma fusca]|uniref:Uncharacterized protein n=1 Tax=Allacma fusca TaxID=39272 RepID=A0A8J2NMI5_9HEXA|nr:unnamed protein product [Allacma fusca]